MSCSEPQLTYRQKLLKADHIILVAVQFLDDLPNHVSRKGMASVFKELVEFIIIYLSIVVQIYRNTKRTIYTPGLMVHPRLELQ